MNRRVVTWVGVDQVGAGWEEKCPLSLTRCRGWYGPGGEEDEGRESIGHAGKNGIIQCQ
jgi:hypothetical protein